MRFGIMAMQIGSLVPPGLSPEAVLAHVGAFDQSAVVRSLVAEGFRLVELGGDISLFFPHALSPAAIEKLGALKEETGVQFTLHLPLWSVEPSTPLTPVRQGSVRALVDAVVLTRPLEPEMIVMHATGALAAEFYRMRLPDIARALLLRQFQSYARSSLLAILGETGIPSRRLAIETIEFPFELTLELAEELDLSVCLDTGHVLVGFSGPITIDEVLDQCNGRLGEIHLHDGPWQGAEMVIGYGRDHQALGMGDLDVGRLLDRLAAQAFDGPVIFELTVPEALASLATIRTICPDLPIT